MVRRYAYFIYLVLNLLDYEYDALNDKLIEIYPEIVRFKGHSPISRAASILGAVHYAEYGRYYDMLLDNPGGDWE